MITPWSGYMNESGGSVSDYINTAIHGQYETDFPELTSKFEKFSIGSSNNNAALFWEIEAPAAVISTQTVRTLLISCLKWFLVIYHTYY